MVSVAGTQYSAAAFNLNFFLHQWLRQHVSYARINGAIMWFEFRIETPVLSMLFWDSRNELIEMLVKELWKKKRRKIVFENRTQNHSNFAYIIIIIIIILFSIVRTIPSNVCVQYS